MNCAICLGKLQPLFTGLFCPRDCDRVSREQIPGSIVFSFAGKEWIGKRVPRGVSIPRQATHAWVLLDISTVGWQDSNASDLDIISAYVKRYSANRPVPGFDLTPETIQEGRDTSEPWVAYMVCWRR